MSVKMWHVCHPKKPPLNATGTRAPPFYIVAILAQAVHLKAIFKDSSRGFKVSGQNPYLLLSYRISHVTVVGPHNHSRLLGASNAAHVLLQISDGSYHCMVSDVPRQIIPAPAHRLVLQGASVSL
jgi:hypothetical protein